MNIIYDSVAYTIIIMVIMSLFPQKINRGRLRISGLIAFLGGIGAAVGVGTAATATAAASTSAVIAGSVVVGTAAAGLAGTLVTGIGSIMGMESQKKANSYNQAMANQQAEIANTQATQALEVGVEKKRQHNANVRQLMGMQAVGTAAAGATIGQGSSMDLMRETASQGAEDAMSIEYASQQQAWGYNNQSNMYSAKANMYGAENDSLTTGQWMTAGATALNTAGSAGTSAYQFFKMK